MAFIVIIVGLLGLCLGSFVNAWVIRLHSHKSVAKGRSECPHCHHQLAWYDLIPVVSYISLGGKCRYCQRYISWQYPVGELAMAITYGLLAWHFGASTPYAIVQLVAWLMIATLLIAAALYDARWSLLPDTYTLPALILAAVLLTVSYLVFGQHQLAWNLVGAAAFAGFYLLLYCVSRGRWIGLGDIILAAIMGLLLSPQLLLVAIFVAYLAGAAVGIVLIRSKKSKSHQMAFGPFLVGGLFVALFWGQTIIDWYLSLI